MYKVFLFVLYNGPSEEFPNGLHIGLAITHKAKWVAGSCSQSADNAFKYLESMKAKIAERVGQPIDEVELVREWRPDLIAKAFETMP